MIPNHNNFPVLSSVRFYLRDCRSQFAFTLRRSLFLCVKSNGQSSFRWRFLVGKDFVGRHVRKHTDTREYEKEI